MKTSILWIHQTDLPTDIEGWPRQNNFEGLNLILGP